MFKLNIKTKSNDRVVGVDISTTSVKLIQIGLKNGRHHVEAYAQLAIVESDLSDQINEDSEHIAGVLERAYNIANPTSNQLVMAVPAALTITRVIAMAANLDEDETEELIRLEAQQHIPYPLDEVSLDFELLQNGPQSADKVNMLLVATLTEHVNKRSEIAELAGLKAKIVEVESHALERCYALISDMLPLGANVVAILDVGHTQSTLIVLDRGRAVYSRDQNVAGKQLTLEIQHRYQMTYAEAERAKQRDSLPNDYQSDILTPFMESIAQQTSRSLQLFFSSSNYSSIDHILLAGGSAKLPGLAMVLQNALGYRVTTANPFLSMSYAAQVDQHKLEKDASSLLVACGLALRGANHDSN